MNQRTDQPVLTSPKGIDLEEVGENLKASYRNAAPRYRLDDEIEVTTANHRHLCDTLQGLCDEISKPIDVLDVGCGTGRYFHSLKNVNRLVGLDISEEMLLAARQPVHQERITAKTTELICGNVYKVRFPEPSFDLIYSLGMFGHGCPVTADVVRRFYELLRPGGILFFNVVHMSSVPLHRRLRKKLKNLAYPLLPGSLQRILNEREQRVPFCGLTRPELEKVLKQTDFKNYSITAQNCDSPLWKGKHLKCIASKDGPLKSSGSGTEAPPLPI